MIKDIHDEYLRGRRGYHRNEHLQRDDDWAPRFPFPVKNPAGRKDQAFFERVVNDSEYRALIREINLAAAKIARQSADEFTRETGRQRFVAGAMGPLPVAASISPDVNDPGFRAVTFDQLRQTYSEQAEALLDGGVDFAGR